MSRKSLTESLKEVLGQADDITEKKIDADADADDENKSLKKADKANGKGTVQSSKKDKTGKPIKEEDELDETTALDTLHPGSGSNGSGDPMPKIQMIAQMIGAASVMSKDDFSHWFTDAIENSKKYSSATDGKATGNRDSLDMKPSHASSSTAPKTAYPMPKLGVKEDLDEALAGFELTEETQSKLTTIFEAAVTARVILENTRLEEEFAAKLDTAVEEISEELSDQIDNYLTYVVEHFMDENKVAIESSLRNELMDEFIDGLQGLFKNHFYTIPESRVDVVEALADKVADLEGKFNEQLDVNKQLQEALVEVEREKLVDTYLEDLALSEADKFLKLVEGVDFDGDLDAYSQKLSVIKENYFGEKSKTPAKSNILDESFEGDSEGKTAHIDPAVARYMEAITQGLKK